METLWAKPPTLDLEAPTPQLAFVEWFPLLALTAIALWFGLNAGFVVDLATVAAEGLADAGAHK